MNETSPAVYAIAALLFPLTLLAIDRLLLRRRVGNLKGALLSALVFWALWVYAAALSDDQLYRKLYAFDLDGDGVFSGAEITPAQEDAMRRYTSDVGRTFAPFTGAIMGFTYSAALFGVATIIDRLRKRWQGAA